MRNRQSSGEVETDELTLYRIYPRKAARAPSLRAIRKALKIESFQVLFDAVTEFAETWEGSTSEERTYCPHASTWFNQERWNDDREEWWAAKRVRDRASKKHHNFGGLQDFAD